MVVILLFIAVDGGTAWMARESVLLETDAVDASSSAAAPWWDLAQQLKQDLANVILFSEGDLQVPDYSSVSPTEWAVMPNLPCMCREQ